MTQPTPDLKPRVTGSAAASDCCGCCEGIAAETPQAVGNRGGLPAIAYRIGDHARFRATLYGLLSSSRYSELRTLRTRDDDDFTIALIDAFACAADVLTFYQERIANESYLRTAVERVSLQEMGKLIGYRLRPGVAAETWLAFTLETPPAPPPDLPPEPGSFVTGVPRKLPLERGLKVQSIPGPGEQAQMFETVEPLAEARPEWNAMRPWLAAPRGPALGDTDLYLTGVQTNLKPGDALIFLAEGYLDGTQPANWDFRLIEQVELQSRQNRTCVRWRLPLRSIHAGLNANTQVHALRRRAGVFGHNAPRWATMPSEFRNAYTNIRPLPSDWPDFTLSPLGEARTLGYVDLDAVYPEIVEGGYVVLTASVSRFNVNVTVAHAIANTATAAASAVSAVAAATSATVGGTATVASPGAVSSAGTAMAIGAAGITGMIGRFASLRERVAVFAVAQASETSRDAFAISSKVTRLGLGGVGYDDFDSEGAPRRTSVFCASERLAIAEYPVKADVALARVPVAVAADGLQPGRRLIVRGVRARDGVAVVVQASLVAVHSMTASHCELEIAPPLAEPLQRESVAVFGNVVPASRGETVSQILGSGDASVAFQRFELKQLPLTYRAAATELGAAAEITLRVSDIAWHEAPTMYGAAPVEHAYTLDVDEQGRIFAAFGDGTRGARLPTGTNNVRATYRKGLGVAGNVGAETLTQLLSRPLGLKGASNPLRAEGGDEPEPAAAARRGMPLATRTLGRAVSLLDYEDFARSFGGIAKAQATLLQLGNSWTVAVTVAGPGGAPLTAASPVWSNLLKALRSSGDPHVRVALLPYQASTFHVGLRVKAEPDRDVAIVLAAVETALRERYGFDARELGQPVQQSEVLAVAQGVPGVVAVDLTRLYGGTQPLAQTLAGPPLVRLLASATRVEGGIAIGAELLTLDAGPLDQLGEMP